MASVSDGWNALLHSTCGASVDIHDSRVGSVQHNWRYAVGAKAAGGLVILPTDSTSHRIRVHAFPMVLDGLAEAVNLASRPAKTATNHDP